MLEVLYKCFVAGSLTWQLGCSRYSLTAVDVRDITWWLWRRRLNMTVVMQEEQRASCGIQHAVFYTDYNLSCVFNFTLKKRKNWAKINTQMLKYDAVKDILQDIQSLHPQTSTPAATQCTALSGIVYIKCCSTRGQVYQKWTNIILVLMVVKLTPLALRHHTPRPVFARCL